jgi:hypothetical protein
MMAQLLRSELPEIATSDKYIVAAFLEFLAGRVTDATLTSGARLCDAGDFQQWLKEVAVEVRK